MPLGRIPLDHQVAAIDVAQSPQFSKEQTRSVVAAVLLDQLGGHDRADDGDPAALHRLRTSGEGPSQHRAAKNGDDLASLHSGHPWVEKMLSHCALVRLVRLEANATVPCPIDFASSRR